MKICDYTIERLHFVLKSGCALEDRQLRTVERLQRFLAVANIVAWRLLWLTYLGRGKPDPTYLAPSSLRIMNGKHSIPWFYNNFRQASYI
jgi:hypothetical protein